MPDNSRPAEPTDGDVVLYTSVRGLLSAVATPFGLIAIGLLASGRFGVSVVTSLLVLTGLALAVVLVVDFPHATAFDTGGITRHCPVRRHRIPWTDVACLDRTPPRAATVLRNLGAKSRGGEREVSGGLVARGRRRRRWLLIDRVESREEHDAVRSLLTDVDEPVEVYAARPHATAPPSSRRRIGRTG